MVPYLGSVVEYTTTGCLDDLFQILSSKVGALDKVIQLADVGVVVFAIVKFERFSRNVRLKRVFLIGQCW